MSLINPDCFKLWPSTLDEPICLSYLTLPSQCQIIFDTQMTSHKPCSFAVQLTVFVSGERTVTDAAGCFHCFLVLLTLFVSSFHGWWDTNSRRLNCICGSYIRLMRWREEVLNDESWCVWWPINFSCGAKLQSQCVEQKSSWRLSSCAWEVVSG